MLGSVDISSKLQLKPGQSVAVLNPPPGLVLPEVVAAATAAEADAIVAFVVRQDDLGSAAQAVAAARADRLAWIGYPKGGQLGTDLNRDRLAAAMAGYGVQPVRQVSLDDTWSALRFRPAKQ
jgi:NAD(P)H-flavin reductase